MASTDAELLAMLESGHWFLKHRKNGETPHSRFVYTQAGSVCWATRSDRKGKVGTLRPREGSELLVVVGASTVVFSGKKKIKELRNRLFSIVTTDRTLDLEAESEAERHLWVRAFQLFAKLHTTDSASVALAPHLGVSTAGEGTPWQLGGNELGVGVGAALGSGIGILDEPEGVHAHLANPDPLKMNSGVTFPKLAATLLVLTGDLRGRWQMWDLELVEGELLCAGALRFLPHCFRHLSSH